MRFECDKRLHTLSYRQKHTHTHDRAKNEPSHFLTTRFHLYYVLHAILRVNIYIYIYVRVAIIHACQLLQQICSADVANSNTNSRETSLTATAAAVVALLFFSVRVLCRCCCWMLLLILLFCLFHLRAYGAHFICHKFVLAMFIHKKNIIRYVDVNPI